MLLTLTPQTHKILCESLKAEQVLQKSVQSQGYEEDQREAPRENAVSLQIQVPTTLRLMQKWDHQVQFRKGHLSETSPPPLSIIGTGGDILLRLSPLLCLPGRS